MKNDLLLIAIAAVLSVAVLAIVIYESLNKPEMPRFSDPVTPLEYPDSLAPGAKLPVTTFTPSIDAETSAGNQPKESWENTESHFHLLPPVQVSDIPVDDFYAEYFNTNDPKTILATEVVDNIAIDYAWSDFSTREGRMASLDSYDFMGRWIGYVDVPEDQTWTFDIEQSWSVAIVKVDDRPIFSKVNDSGIVTHPMKKGRHLVEAVFENNWHTAEFSVDIVTR